MIILFPVLLRTNFINLKSCASAYPPYPLIMPFFLLKNAISIPRLNYLLRFTPCWKKMNSLHLLDDALKAALEEIINCSLSSSAWSQATLPICMGGMGFRKTTELALSAFLASVHSCAPLIPQIIPNHDIVSSPVVSECLQIWLAPGRTSPISESTLSLRCAWDFPIFEQTYDHLLKNASSTVDKSRLLSACSNSAGKWLEALPSSNLGTLLDNHTLRIATSLTLGSKICESHTCICGFQVEENGLHGLSCLKSAGRRSRHDSINDLIKRSLVSAGFPSVLEPIGTCLEDGKRTDGMTMIRWSKGKALLWDATCVDTYAASHLSLSSVSAGAAASEAEVKKQIKYRSLSNGYNFVAVGLETSGVLGKQTSKFLKELGKKLISATREPRSSSFLLQRISIAIQRGNSANILATHPKSRGFDEIFLSSFK